jgi:hypothetical protein
MNSKEKKKKQDHKHKACTFFFKKNNGLTFITIQSSNPPNLVIYSLKPSVSISHGIPKTYKLNHTQKHKNPQKENSNFINLQNQKQLTNHKLSVHSKQLQRRPLVLLFGDDKKAKKRNPKIESDNLSSLSVLLEDSKETEEGNLSSLSLLS